MSTNCGRLAEVAAELGGEATWTVAYSGVRKRAVLLVRKEPHCLHDLLGRVAAGELPVRLEAVIGNHEALADVVRAHRPCLSTTSRSRR
jgi:formyltetrahydrofolate deformylase